MYSLFQRLEISRRDRVLRVYLRLLRARQTEAAKRDAVSRILSEDDAFEVFAASLESDYGAAAGERPLLDLLKWLLDNADEIIALILKIIDIFVQAPD